MRNRGTWRYSPSLPKKLHSFANSNPMLTDQLRINRMYPFKATSSPSPSQLGECLGNRAVHCLSVRLCPLARRWDVVYARRWLADRHRKRTGTSTRTRTLTIREIIARSRIRGVKDGREKSEGYANNLSSSIERNATSCSWWSASTRTPRAEHSTPTIVRHFSRCTRAV